MHCRVTVLLVITALVSLVAESFAVRAEEPWNDAFERTWARADRPVADLDVSRTWMWGPRALTTGVLEPYAEASGGTRLVQYFDKSRMEINVPDADPRATWYVTNGLLVKELITGQMQVGDNTFVDREPAEVNVAGDPDDPGGPTYRTMSRLLTEPALTEGDPIVQRVARDGVVTRDASLEGYRVTTTRYVPETNHTVASPFWDFMTSSGLVYESGELVEDALFENPFYATGFPITEAYWTTAMVAGKPTDVLLQCFERRCLTYTPDNPPGWQVEAGNVGQHYFQWRYAAETPVSAPRGEAPVIVLDPGHDRSSGGALGIEYQDTLRTALATKDALEAAGYVVYLTRSDNETVLLDDPNLLPPNAGSMDPGYVEGYAHSSRALSLQPDLVISLHYNASSDPDVAGLTVYYCDQGGSQNAVLADLIRYELRSALESLGYDPPYAAIAEDGTIGKVYGHLATLGNVYREPFAFESNRLVGIPAVLTEPLFETNPTERELIERDATHQAFARAYVRAVDRYFGR